MARQFTKPLDLYNHQVATFEKLAVSRKKGHEELATEALADSKELNQSSPQGSGRLALLQSLGHPFGRGRGAASGSARRGAAGSLPLLPIGVISGDLRKSLNKKSATTKYTQSFDVGAVSGAPKYAKFILGRTGTSKMVARGYPDEIKRRWKARNKAFIDYYKRHQQGTM